MTTPLVRVMSPRNGDILSYPLAILKGNVRNEAITHVLVSTSKNSTPHLRYPVHDGIFIAQYLLSSGTNTIHIRAVCDQSELDANQTSTTTIQYNPLPPDSPTVRLLYVNASDSDGTFQSPCTDNSEADAKQRLFTLGLMLQSATAELLHEQGLPRRTFRVDDYVHTLTLQNVTVEEMHAKDEVELFYSIYNELHAQSKNHPDIIHIAVMSFTRFIDGKAYAHTAIGGEHLALFGGASLFTWPTSAADICEAFCNSSPFDGQRFFDDSENRAAQLGQCTVAATTIGACLHEVGHCLSLPHPYKKGADQRAGIMGRGFDYIDSLFVQHADSGERPIPHWDRGSAVRLHYHRFLRPSIMHVVPETVRKQPFQQHQQISTREFDKLSIGVPMRSPSPSPSPLPSPARKDSELMKEYAEQTEMPDSPLFRKEQDGRTHCFSKYGIGHIGYYCNGDNACHDEFLASPPRDFRIPTLSQLRNQCGAKEGDRITLSAIDIEGHITEIDFNEDVPSVE